ncbi:hypothetical protein LTR95_016518 [Oleoguttula sp. CCFEE 5521]
MDIELRQYGTRTFLAGSKSPAQNVIQHCARADGHSIGINGLDDSVDDVGACFEEFRNEEVEQLEHGVIAAQADDAESHVLDDRGAGLAVHLFAIDEGSSRSGVTA